MNKLLLIALFSASILSSVNAQKKDTLKTDTLKFFKYGGFTSLTFNQVAFSNWAAGGENAMSATGVLNLFGKYKKDKIAWDNTLDLGYGITKTQQFGVQKNTDNIELNSKLGYQAGSKFFYTFLVNFRSQFSNGYNYPNDSVPVSKFMAPGYLTLSLGIDYKLTNYFSFYLSPAAGRFTFVLDQTLADEGAYGVDPAVYQGLVKVKNGQIVRPEFGAALSTAIQKDIIKYVNLDSRLDLFNDYTDKNKANRGNIDVNWNLMINIKAGKYLTTTILTNLIYDQEVIAKTQLKEGIGVGLSYKI